MKEILKDTELCVEKELILPICVKDSHKVDAVEELLIPKAAYIPFTTDGVVRFAGKGAGGEKSRYQNCCPASGK